MLKFLSIAGLRLVVPVRFEIDQNRGNAVHDFAPDELVLESSTDVIVGFPLFTVRFLFFFALPGFGPVGALAGFVLDALALFALLLFQFLLGHWNAVLRNVTAVCFP